MAGVLYNHFPAIAAALRPALSKIVDETADECVTNIREQIIANGQIDTGDMLNGIAKEDGPDDLTKEITSAMTYWIFQNYGTRYMAARPFVEPGLDRARPGFLARCQALESLL